MPVRVAGQTKAVGSRPTATSPQLNLQVYAAIFNSRFGSFPLDLTFEAERRKCPGDSEHSESDYTRNQPLGKTAQQQLH